MLLVPSDALPGPIAAQLDADTPATVVGGPAAIGDAVLRAIDERAGSTERLAGATRFGTSAKVAEAALAAGVGTEVVYVATGYAFPDGLVAGAAAGAEGAVLLLVDGEDPEGSPETLAVLTAHRDEVSELRIAGGSAAVSEAVEEALAAAITTG